MSPPRSTATLPSSGHAFTIGAIWLCACDTRIGDRGPFKIGMTETRMDMMITPWVLEPLSQRLSKQHWVASVVQARVYDPDEAPEVGFLDEVLPEGGATDRAMEVAAGFPARAHAANKLMTRAESIEIARADVTEL